MASSTTALDEPFIACTTRLLDTMCDSCLRQSSTHLVFWSMEMSFFVCDGCVPDHVHR